MTVPPAEKIKKSGSPGGNKSRNLQKKNARKNARWAIKAFAIIIACVTVLSLVFVAIPYVRYKNAMKLYNAGLYTEAMEAFEKVGGLIDCSDMIEKCNDGMYEDKFDSAVSLYQNGQYAEAIYYFNEISDYKNSSHLIERCYTGRYGTQMYELLSTVKTGESFTLGHYEQDNNPDNGEEDIEWLVLAKEKDKILVTSKYILDAMETDNSDTSGNKEKVNKWLNTVFAEDAFTYDEYSFVKEAGSFYRHYEMSDIIDTDSDGDMLFLLSTAEMYSYFSTDEERQGEATAYALAQGVAPGYIITEEGVGTGWRTLHLEEKENSVHIAVAGSESLTESGTVSAGLRPAFWIDFISSFD